MNWQPFKKESCPKNLYMLFLDNRSDWFAGKLIEDSEYGLIIEDFDERWGTDDITHYLIVDTNIKTEK